MDVALKQTTGLDLVGKIRAISDMCRISNIEKLLSDGFEGLPETSATVDYIGELNKNDVMH